MDGVVQALPVTDTTGRQVMQTPEDVALMLRSIARASNHRYICDFRKGTG